MSRYRLFFLSLIMAVYLGNIKAQDATYTNEILAPGYNKLTFDAPKAGSYTLAKYSAAADGNVINADSSNTTLHDLYDDKVVLLNFMYSTCVDVNGCPLATAVFHKIKNQLAKEPDIGKNVRLISLSFDPNNDTPDVMKLYGTGADNTIVDWSFLTTNSTKTLDPILDSYNQRIIKDYDNEGNYIGTISHILRVFLIDKEKSVRNIYSVSFLHSDILINDIKTLLDERTANGSKVIVAESNTSGSSKLAEPGDNKEGYESKDYVSGSKSLTSRKGKATDLIKFTQKKQLGLPKLKLSEKASLTREKISLGRKLFYDRRLSHTDTISCAICHVAEMGFAHNELKTAVGTEGRSVPRNAPTIINTGFLTRLFHDGRETSLENQVWGPLLAHNEMANPSPGYIINKLNAIPDYKGLFEEAFGEGPSIETISRALASYQYTLISGNSAFDRWYYGKDRRAISNDAKKGFELFKGKGQCIICHLVGEDYALFTDEKLHNTGLGYQASMHKEPPKKKVTLGAGIVVEVDTSSYAGSKFTPEIVPNDLGLYTITQDPNDRWKFRTPPLRNVEFTAPYMHNGAFSTLKEVVEFYNKGGVENEVLSPLIRPLNLTEEEIDNIVEFLKTLTGSNLDELILDAHAAPIGELTLDDPNWFHENKPKY